MQTRRSLHIPRGNAPTGRHRAAFTLLELLVALFIFALLGGSVYMVIRSSADAYSKGNATMEVYQSVRVGLDRMLADLRRAVSSESIWNNQPKDEDIEEFIDEVAGLDYEPEPEEDRDIMFQGTLSEVLFVIEDILVRADGRGFDLREVVYRIDREEKVLVKEIRDSIIRRRLNELRAERTEDETEFRAAYPDQFEWSGESDRIVVANNVVDMTLAYYDGKEWKQDWNSEREYRRDEYGDNYGYGYDNVPEEERQEGPRERHGLPDAVAVTLTLTNRDEVSAITEIPARDMDILLAVNETPFLRRWWGGAGGYNREIGIDPRGG